MSPDDVRNTHLARVSALAAGLRAERAKSAELLAALMQLVDAAEDADHLEECNVGFCDCAAAQWQAHAAAARAAVARATGGEAQHHESCGRNEECDESDESDESKPGDRWRIARTTGDEP